MLQHEDLCIQSWSPASHRHTAYAPPSDFAASPHCGCPSLTRHGRAPHTPSLPMKNLHWSSGDPLDCWDNPNCFFGADGIGKRREPGDPGYVPWHPPGYQPPPQPKTRKPFRRRAKTKNKHDNTTPTSSTAMPTFKYNVAPNSNGGFTTRPVIGTLLTEQAFIQRMMDRTGLSQEQCESATDAVFDIICACATGCDHATDIRGRFRFRPTSGGSQPSPDAFNNAGEINADIAISLTAAKREDWQSQLTLESMGEVGKLSPVIDSILSQENGQADVYIPGTLIVINGDNLRFDKTDTQQGVFVRSGDNPEVRLTTYGTITPGSLSVLMPGTLTGPQTVRVAAHINGSVRSFTYMTPVAQSA